jgi:hypothetical protein
MNTDPAYLAAFDAELAAALAAHDWEAWQSIRAFFADYLEDHDHALYPIARAPARHVPLRIGRNVWGWQLYLRLPDNARARRQQWHRGSRLNGLPLLGFPSLTWRCGGYDQPGGVWWARFTVRWRPHVQSLRRFTRPERNPCDLYRLLDTNVHVHGFAAMFWPPNWSPDSAPTAPRQRSLFGN